LGVKAESILILFQDLADDDGAVLARINCTLATRSGELLPHDLNAGLLVIVLRTYLLEHLGGTQERYAAARQNAFLDRGAGRVHRVVDATLRSLTSTSVESLSNKRARLLHSTPTAA
jgi:hypothetical protein